MRDLHGTEVLASRFALISSLLGMIPAHTGCASLDEGNAANTSASTKSQAGRGGSAGSRSAPTRNSPSTDDEEVGAGRSPGPQHSAGQGATQRASAAGASGRTSTGSAGAAGLVSIGAGSGSSATGPAQAGSGDKVLTGAAGSAAGTGTNNSLRTRFAGEWSGTTSQSKQIGFVIVDGVLTALRISYSLSGTGCSSEGMTTTNLKMPISMDGFPFDTSSGGLTLRVNASFDGDDSARGDFNVMQGGSTPGVPSCRASASGSWTATKRTDVPDYDGMWSGKTSQDEAFSFVVSHNQITSFSIGYSLTGSCPVANATTTSTLATPSSILSGTASLWGTDGDVHLNGEVTFDSASKASGKTSINSFKTQGQTSCTGNASVTWTAEKL